MAETSDAPASSPPTTAAKPADTNADGVFSGWGIDVNAVAHNISDTLFAPPSPNETTDETGTENVPSTATALANVASTELEMASKVAQETIGKAAEEIGRGWGNFNTFLDDMLAPKVNNGDDSPTVDVHKRFCELFADIAQDEVVDHFQCALLQKYRCYLNNATPEKAFPLHGHLFVTTAHLAMHVTDDGMQAGRKTFSITVPLAEVSKVQKGANAMLRVVTKSQSSYILAEFVSDTHFKGALSLLEHMTGGMSRSAGGGGEGDPEEQ